MAVNFRQYITEYPNIMHMIGDYWMDYYFLIGVIKISFIFRKIGKNSKKTT